jgi:outer membrane protein OmpA-like peptidoglycan-associated protein
VLKHSESEAPPAPREQRGEHQGDVTVIGGHPAATPGAAFAERRQMRPVDVLALQRTIGNHAVQGMIQRDESVPPDGGSPPNPELERFLGTHYVHTGSRFDLDYNPTGGGPIDQRPISGNIAVTLRLHVTFKNFDRQLRRQPPYNTFRFSRAQLADFNWTDAERSRFRTDMASSIESGWRGKHRFTCTAPGLEEVSAGLDVKVELVADPALAHNKVTALKIPSGAPRFRSFVQGDTSTLEIRDPTESEESQVTKPEFVRQVAPFELGKAELTPELTGQLDAIVGELRPLQEPGQQQHGLGENLVTVFRGRASTPGSRSANQTLATTRARNAEEYVTARMGWTPQLQARGAGEQNATDEARFQRVDVEVVNLEGVQAPVRQNVAAHEAGHMFGLGDEYEDLEAHRLTGDKPSHFGDVEAELGTDSANELLAGNSGSMMSVGGRVDRGHYVSFLRALESATGKQWTIPG